MKPLFTIHAGEYLAGSFIENKFKNCRVWIPAKDDGIDLLVTNATDFSKGVPLQVKFSKDYKSASALSKWDELVMHTWFRLNTGKIKSSKARYWVFVLQPFVAGEKTQYLIIPPAELLRRIAAYHGKKSTYNLFFLVNKKGGCWDTRGLRKSELKKLAANSLTIPERDFSKFLNNWSAIGKLT